MNASNFFAGIAVIIVGAFLLFAGPQVVLIPSTQTEVTSLFHDETFMVGDLWERSVQLDEGILVKATIAVSSALTGEPSEISTLVTDQTNYQKWVAHDSPTFVIQRQMTDKQSFSFTIPNAGTYHFILDNTSSPVKKKVTISVDLQREVLVNRPDERVRYVAYGLLACGLLLTVVGILRKTQIPWA